MSKKTPEGKVLDQMLTFLKEKGIYYERRQAQGGSYRKGAPDFWMVVGMTHIEIEVKAPGEAPSASQVKWQERFDRMHIPCFTIDSLEELQAIILACKLASVTDRLIQKA